MATLKTMLMNQLAKEDEYAKVAATRGNTSGSSTSSVSAEKPREEEKDDSLLTNRPKLTWTLGEAQDFLGMEEVNEENINAKFKEVYGDATSEAALKTVFMAENLTQRYEDDLLSLNQNMASILSSGGFDSVDDAANYVFRNDDGSSRYRFLSSEEQAELVRPVEYDLAAMEEAFRIKYAEMLDSRNAASDPDAASRMVDLQKNAVIANEGSLLQPTVNPTNYLRKKSMYEQDSASVLADGVLWAGTAKPKVAGVLASAAGAPVKPSNEQIKDYYKSEKQQNYSDGQKKDTGLVGKYADWTDDQKSAAQKYIGDLQDGQDLSDALIELHAAGLSDEAIYAFQMGVLVELNRGDSTEETVESWFEPVPEPVPEYEPAPAEERLPEVSIVDNRSESMKAGDHIVTMEKVHEAINNGDWETAAELQYGMLVDMVSSSDDAYVQELVHSEGSQKAATALMQMVQKSGLPNRLDDPDIRAQLRVYESYILEALGIEQEPLTEFVQFLDNALNQGGRLVEAQQNEGLGLTHVMQWALDNTAYRVTDIANKFVGAALIGAGRVFRQDSWVKTGEEISAEQSSTIAAQQELLMSKGTPLEILAAQAGSETAKMYTFGAASQWISKGNAVFFGEKLKWLQRALTSVPFSAESGIQEFHDAYTQTEGDTATSFLSSLGAFSAATLANQFDGILPNLEAAGMPYIGEVVDKLNAIPGAGVKATIARWGKAGQMWLWNMAKTSVNEGLQEGAENILTTAVTDAIKGGSIFDRDWSEYSKEITADMLMGSIISTGSSVSVMPAYSRSVQVAESMMRKSAVTMADVGSLMDAMAQDLQDPVIAEEARERASAAAIESRTGELIASGAVDSSKATAANELRREAQKHFVSAQREEQRTRTVMQQAHERMKANGNDKESTNAAIAAIEAHKNAGLTLRGAEEKLAKANQTYEEERAAVKAEAQQMAKQEIGEQLLARQQERQQREVAREQQRQDANADVLEVDDFIASDLAPEGWDPTPEEREYVARAIQERRNARAANRSQNAELTVPDTKKRFISAIEKKFGTKVTVLDTSKGGTVLRYNGAYDPRTDSIVIDSNATQSDLIYGTMLHELTHKAEKSQTYQEFASAILRLKYGQDDTRLAADIRAKQESYNRGLAAMAQLDESVDATPLTADQASRELVADLTREILYGDEASINQLVAEQPSVARRMLDTIKNFIKKLTGTKDPALDQLNRTRELFEKALWESAQQMKPREKRSFPTDNIQYSLREEEPPKKTIKGYKVFAVFPNKPGELYPPMVANPGGADTPVGVWLNADAAPSAGETKTGRPQVQAGGKGTNTGKQKLAYRPGWHLGDSPRATQFNRLNPETGKKELFPENFVWAECDVAADLDYQEEAMSYGYNAKGNFQHSLAGLPRLPREEDGTAGFYRYRTNPNPDTVPWIISGAIKVNRILDDNETRAILNEQKQEFMSGEEYASLSDTDKEKALERFDYIERKGGDIDLAKFGLTAGDVDAESRVQYSLDEGMNGRLLSGSEYSRLLSNWNDQQHGTQFENRPNGGKIIAMDNLLVYTDENGEPEQVVEVNQDDLWLQNDIQQDLVLMEQEGFDLETQRIVLESSYGTGSAYFRDRGAVQEPAGQERAGAGRNARAVRKGNYVEISYEGEEVADIIRDGVTKSYSLASWTPEERRTVRDTLLEKGYEPEAVEKWIDDVDSVASIVANDKARLDFTADPDQVMLKNNQEYVKTLDASTLCAKRLLYQGTFNEIQHLLPNTPLASDQLLDLLNMMKDAGYESPCGVCYVESRRRHLGKYAQEWLDGYNGEYKPTLDEVTTTDGLAKLKKEHPKAHDAFIAAMKAKGSANPKVVELRTDYRGDIRKISERDAEKIRRIGGLRVQSFSDFETPHMLDMMQATLDMASKGLTSQAYTKVPNFAWVFGDTGIKINLSLLAEGNGLDADGNLIFSSSEGMDIDEALRLRDRYSENVGTIIVGANDAHIRAAMADPRIDYIIPFHRSGWGQNELKKVGVLQTYTDYQASQNERTITGYKKNGKPEYGKPEGGNFYPIDYWDYSKSGDENAATYLRLCEEDGRVPKFDQFLEKDADGHWVAPSGYWKMLIDFKMYDNDGNGAPQKPVQPVFNMEEAHRVLDEYEGGADELPVAQDIVERFVAEYKAANPRTQYSLPSDMVLAEMIDRYLARQEQGGIAPPNTTVGQPVQQEYPRMGKRQFANQTLQDSTAMPDWLKQELRGNPAESDYEIDSNYAQAERGWQRIQENGYEQERDRLLQLERFSADDTAEANLIMAMAEREGDAETLLSVASAYNREGTKAGQELQARKLFSRMSPTAAKVMVAGQLESRLQDELRERRPLQRRMDEHAQRVTDRLTALPEPEEASSDNRWHVPLNQQQMELIREYGLQRTRRPGIYYNRATTEQRMLEAILATPNPLAATGNGLNLVQRLEYMNSGLAVVTNADLNYIGTQLGQFIGLGGEVGSRDADVAVARAYEAFGNITPVGRRQKMRTWRYMSMLGTLTSPERNIIGNVAQSVPNAVSHGLAANVVDPIVSLFTGQRTTASLDVRERVEGWRAFVQETKDTFKDFFVDRVEVQNRLDDKFNTNRSGRVYQSPVLEAARNLEGFLMSVGDRNFWKKAYVNSIAEQQKLLDRGLLRNEDGITPTQEQILERAEADANYATFNEDNRVRDAVTALKQVPGLGDAIDFIMPFTGVPTNIISRMWQYSPMGLASTVLTHAYRGMSGQNFDQRAFVDGISRGITGTALFGVGMILQAAGIIRLGTGDEEDDKKYGVRTAQGEQYTPYIYNPFNDEYVGLAAFAPAISPLIMGATAHDILKDEPDKVVALQNAAFSGMDQIFDASYMTGLADVFGGYGNPTENIATSLFASAVSQNVPALLGQLADAMDPYVRDTKDKNLIMESLKSGLINNIPGLRESLPKKIDVTGQPVMQGKEGIENFFNPFTVTDARNDEVLNEMMRVSESVGNSTMLPSDALSGRKNDLTISGVDFTVDAAGKEAYKQRYGDLWYNGGTYVDGNGNKVKVQGVADLIESSAYAKMSDTEKAKAIEKTLKLASSVAKAEAAVAAGENRKKVFETVTSNQKSVAKSNTQIQIEAGHYNSLSTYVSDLKKAGSSSQTIKSEVTKLMKPIYQELNRKGDTEKMKEIRRILYQTGLYDKYNFEKNWLN